MGRLDDAYYYIAPAYLATFIAFGLLWLLTMRRLNAWSRRARDEDELDRSAEEHTRSE